MPDTKITALTALTAADPANDVLPIVDVSDTTMAASGTTKKISINNVLGCSGTATLASATITGDLTVDTSTLKVDSANDRVGIGIATPAWPLDIRSATAVAQILSTTGTNAAYLQVSNTGGIFYLGRENSAGTSFASPAYSAVLYAGGAYPLVTTVNGSERYRIASDGVATWSNVGGVAGTAMTLNSTGLGVGVAPELKLRVDGPDAAPATSGSSTTNGAFRIGAQGASTNLCVDAGVSTTGGAYGWFQARSRANYATNYDLVLNPNGGNVGIGVTPSAGWRAGARALQLGAARFASLHEATNGSANLAFGAYESGSNAYSYTTTGDAPSRYSLISGRHEWYNAPSGTAGNAITFTQAMTLDASGNLLVGTTTTSGNAGGLKLSNVGGTLGQITFSNNSGVADYVARFNYGSTPTLVGTITVDSGGTTYNTTSDYRLKESVQPLVGGLARVSALKPSIYKWKSDGSSGEGFLAHELAEVVPFAVTGKKDAVNEDGSVKAQGVDLSRVVPILVAAIQELAAEVNALKNA